MPSNDIFDRYLLALRATPLEQKTEHTDRAALQALLQAVADAGEAGVGVQHEPKRVAGRGAPDFKITKSSLILGYVENKAIDENLDRVLKSDQISRYKGLSQNIVVTDYLRFVWVNKGNVKHETLCHATDLETPRFRLREDRVAAVAKLLGGFFSTVPEGIGRAEQLALALAARSKLLRDYLGEELVRQEREHQEARLFGLFQIFRDQVFHALTLKEFADAYAQMLAYGLFLARLNSGSNPVTLHNAREFVPRSFRLIRELVDFLSELEKDEYREIRWVVEEVLSIVNGLDLPAIHEDLSFRQRKAISRKVRAADEEEHRLFERDPFIYFYEDYLKTYDPAMRKGRGVYYTPPPIVNFIVRAVDDILKDSFGIREGLADHHRVTVLDFACGTGTFLLEVCQRIFDNIGGPDAGRADLIVREHILKNLFGFEYLIAPYTIAHLKLSQYLEDQKHPLKEIERLQVFLTNTLEPIEPQANFLLPAVSAEVAAAQQVKDQPILVMVGNPPYAARSKNNGAWIRKQIKTYEFVDGQHFGERKHWLNDDYVKFLRFAQIKIEGRGEGVVGVITNRWWLENVTFRGMRQSLLTTFDQIYVFDLQGEVGGAADKNVFDIKKGVAIALLIKNSLAQRRVRYASIRGGQLAKYHACMESNLDNVRWLDVNPTSPNYFLVPRSEFGRDSYEAFWGIPKIFAGGSTGVLTARDRLAVAENEAALQQNLQLLVSEIADRDVEKRFNLEEVKHWSLSRARQLLREQGLQASLIRPLAYRPFDTQVYYDHDAVVFRRRRKVMQWMTNSNIGLAVCRLTKGGPWRHCLVAGSPANDSYVSDKSKERGYLFPLAQKIGGEPTTNLGNDFRTHLDLKYEQHYPDEEIFGYIYAVLHAPTYRARYAEFLRDDFPRVPLPESAGDFEALSGLGWALVQAHLLRELPRQGLAEYHGRGDHRVEAVRYAPAEQAIAINKTQSFRPVPQAVWDFHIGGYQVLDKYLKSRRGRVLSLEEIDHVGAVADSLAFTIEQMARIDEAYRTAFPDPA
jgi:Type ISP C-terminal specificity domain/N-6 DNA Methylase